MTTPNTPPSITIIGDVHGKMHEYLSLTRQHPYTLQLGDMGFNYHPIRDLDPAHHRFIGGNHDGYSILATNPPPGYISRYEYPMWHGIFTIPGAFSVDAQYRTPGIDLWPEDEELHGEEMARTLSAYTFIRPSVVVSHDCPDAMRDVMLEQRRSMFGRIDTRTGAFLELLRRIHQPNMWIFGHWHRSTVHDIGKTTFICLDELETLVLDAGTITPR